MEGDKDMEHKLDFEQELSEIPKWPKLAKYLLLIFIGLSIILVIVVIVLAVSSRKKSKDIPDDQEPEEEEENFNFTCSNISIFPNLFYNESDTIINSFRIGGDNYNANMGEINNGQNYEKNERNIYDLYIPNTAFDRKNKKNGIFL